MIWEHGTYKWSWDREFPTIEKYNSWKREFLSYAELDNFEVWLTGGLLEKWTSWDIDIILLGPRDEKILKEIMYKGMDLGITKYNMYVVVKLEFHEAL